MSSTADTKVPFFGDIPVIGRLFQNKGNANRKVDLVIYLTPFIVRKSEDLTRLRKFLSELEDVEKRYARFIKEHGGRYRPVNRPQERKGKEVRPSTASKPVTAPARKSRYGNRALDALRTRP